MNREKIYFSIPAKAEFLSVIRLTTSAIGSKMNFDIDKALKTFRHNAIKNGEYTDKDIISREPYNKHDSYFAIWSV